MNLRKGQSYLTLGSKLGSFSPFLTSPRYQPRYWMWGKQAFIKCHSFFTLTRAFKYCAVIQDYKKRLVSWYKAVPDRQRCSWVVMLRWSDLRLRLPAPLPPGWWWRWCSWWPAPLWAAEKQPGHMTMVSTRKNNATTMVTLNKRVGKDTTVCSVCLSIICLKLFNKLSYNITLLLYDSLQYE